MIDLLMLGIVPGTNIQIDFRDWLIVMSASVACVLLLVMLRHRIGTVLLMIPAIRHAGRHINSMHTDTRLAQ